MEILPLESRSRARKTCAAKGFQVEGMGLVSREEAFMLHVSMVKVSGLSVGSRLCIAVKASKIWLYWGPRSACPRLVG